MSGSLAPAAKIFFLSDEKSMFVLSASHLSWFHLTSASAIKLGTVVCAMWNTIGNMTRLFHGTGTLCARRVVRNWELILRAAAAHEFEFVPYSVPNSFTLAPRSVEQFHHVRPSISFGTRSVP